MAEQKGLGAHLGGHLRENGMLVALVAIVVLFSVLLQLQPQPVSFLKAQNITNIFLQNGHVIILALGMLLVIVAGHIDLSVGSVAAFTGAVAAWLTVNVGLPFYIVIPLTLVVGGLIGAAQGYWVAFWRIPSFIVTLAGMMVFRGATMWMLGGQNIGPFPKGFQALSNGFIPDLTGIGRPHGLTLIVIAIAIGLQLWLGLRARARDAEFGITPEPSGLFWARNLIIAAATAFVGWQLASFRGLPNVMVVLAVLTALYAFFTENTVTGRRIYALGGNEKAAKLSGIRTDRLVFLCFVNMGVLAALAGMIVTARLNSATPKAGTGFELDAIASVFIGGASMTGGSGKIVGVVIGALIMGVMNMGMSILGIGSDYQMMIKGLVLLVAVIFDVYNKNK
ncbi:MAG: sugar ABC transporter permease [Rhodobacteraceae bacterium]|uniref:multiple monosaccharide ABC transporter permease n=1 Tax=Tabrizicola sp. SY72 TaxID=2741673 RepID=UPI0015746330|nr:multiple monosaccharide ABC transporter permease [Tabrizicola sp. SY72]MBL9055025.1 sugar ABC transporter permease [Paracoccaceae bacterium]NTT85582.1 sugar ABC transporter permease [Tabrizicola sp. SY72]